MGVGCWVGEEGGRGGVRDCVFRGFAEDAAVGYGVSDQTFYIVEGD